jgi:hypothetical protein
MGTEPTLTFLGEQMQRMFELLRGMDARLERIENDITVLTGAFMRYDGEREGDRLSAAGLLAKQRRIEARLGEIERRLDHLEGAET